jgi:hypothetical protein
LTVTQRLMKPGSFRVELVEDYPASIAQAVRNFDHIVITPTRLQPIEGFSDANILAAACYTGVVREKPSPRIFQGSGLEVWLGTEEGLGDLLDTAVTRTTGTLSQWIGDLRPASLSAGSVDNTGMATSTNSYQWMTRREAIDSVCRLAGAEWRVNPDFTLDAKDPDTLFTTATPSVVITRKEEGPDGTYRGLEGTLIVQAQDVKQYTTKVFAVTQGADLAGTVTSSTGSTSYVDGLNGALVMERVISAPTEPSGNASALAASFVSQYNQVRRELSLNSRTYNVTRFVEPGDTVYVYDQLAELTDSANQIVYRGEVISPIKLRVYALTWPLERGMGVYARRSGATPTYTDLTDFVQWEDGEDVIWEVGAASRPLNDATATGGSAYLGANPDVAETARNRGTYTPTLSGMAVGTGGSAANTATWTLNGDVLHIEGIVTFGTSGQTFPTAPTIALPSGFLFANADTSRPCGQALLRDPGVAGYSAVLLVESSSTFGIYQQNTASTYAAVATLTTTTPFTYAAGDQIIWTAELHVVPA